MSSWLVRRLGSIGGTLLWAILPLLATAPVCPDPVAPCGSEAVCARGDIYFCEDFSDVGLTENCVAGWSWKGADVWGPSCATCPGAVQPDENSCYIGQGSFGDPNGSKQELVRQPDLPSGDIYEPSRQDAPVRWMTPDMDGRNGLYVRYMVKHSRDWYGYGEQKHAYVQRVVGGAMDWSVMFGTKKVQTELGLWALEPFVETDCKKCIYELSTPAGGGAYRACDTADDCPGTVAENGKVCEADAHCMNWRTTYATWGSDAGPNYEWAPSTLPEDIAKCQMVTEGAEEWYQVEWYFKCEAAAGDNTGAIQVWVNGALCLDYRNIGNGVQVWPGGYRKNVCFDVSPSVGGPTGFAGATMLNSFWTSHYWGGGSGVPNYPNGRQSTWFDNIVLSTNPIGGPLSSPTGVALGAGGVRLGAVPLQWTDNATGETDFLLERQLYGTATWTPITVPADTDAAPSTTIYTDAAPAGQYTYRVRARAGTSNTLSWATSVSGVPVTTVVVRGARGTGVRFAQILH